MGGASSLVLHSSKKLNTTTMWYSYIRKSSQPHNFLIFRNLNRFLLLLLLLTVNQFLFIYFFVSFQLLIILSFGIPHSPNTFSLDRIRTIMGSLRTCFISLAAVSRKLNSLKNKFSCRMGRKPNKPMSSNFSWLTTDRSFPTMELSNQLKHVFKFIDTNGDGKISPQELTQVLHSLGQEKSSAAFEAEVMVREMDRDGDGLVDLEEFMSVMGRTSDHGIPTLSAKEEDLFEAFLIFDTDKNGFISAKELQRVLLSLGCREKCSLKHCRRMIKGIDKDGDGFVNFEEFKSMMTMNVA